jgi:SagB-type dehydrogenase family enzyme
MKTLILFFCLAVLSILLAAQNPGTIVLDPPDKDGGMSTMKAFALRSSAREFDTTELKLKDLSDLLWAADGINRPESGKRTAPSAMNAQDIDIYVFMKTGVYLYDAGKHTLEFAAAGDHRKAVAGRQENMAKAPVMLVLVSDISRFRSGGDSLKITWAYADAGIVSQNIALYCASAGLATRPRGTMDQEKLRAILQLKDSQYPVLNNPVSYKLPDQ